MKILLINPPSYDGKPEGIVGPPLGLASLASCLLAAGQEVEILDAFALGLSWKAFSGVLERTRADFVGIGGMTPIIESSYRAARLARPKFKWLALGGPHVSAVRGKVFEELPELDFALAGEAEETLPALVKALERDDLAALPAIAGLLQPGREDRGSPLIADLDALPLPARQLLPLDRYRHPLFGGEPMATVMTSRGCPYGCIFCDKAVTGRNWRSRSAQSVVEELTYIRRELRVRAVIFYDDLFTLDPARVIDICKGILERDLGLRWKCEGRVNLVEEEALGWMKRAGCELVAYGVETVHPAGLKFLHKGITPDDARRAFAATRAAGMKTLGYFLLGIPGERYEDELQTIAFARELRADYAQFALLAPFPGTPLYAQAQAAGWYREGPALGPAEQGGRRPRLITPEWTEENLRSIQRRAYTGFYLRPGYILRRLAGVGSGAELAAGVREGLRLLRWRWSGGT